MRREIITGANGHRTILEYTTEEDDPQWIAIQMAGAYSDHGRFNLDATKFQAAAQAERQKAMMLQGVIFQLKQRERSGFVVTSRMDPLASYDMDACQTQLKGHRAEVLRLQRMANECTQKAAQAQQNIARFERLLAEAKAAARG